MVSSSLAFHRFSSLTCCEMLASSCETAAVGVLETYLFDLVLVRGLEDAVAGDVVALASDVFAHLTK